MRVSGLLAGLGGVMSAARLFAANGLQLGQSYELDAIAAVILGGTSFVGGIGSIWGTLIGALIIAVLSNGLVLVGVSDIWQFIIKGLVIIGAVGARPAAAAGRRAHLIRWTRRGTGPHRRASYQQGRERNVRMLRICSARRRRRWRSLPASAAAKDTQGRGHHRRLARQPVFRRARQGRDRRARTRSTRTPR